MAAKLWLPTYVGKHVFKAYRKWYDVDWPTALRELEMLGVPVDPDYREQVLRAVQQQAEQKRQKRLEKTDDDGHQYGVDYDDNFAVIVGETSGGVSFGVSWEEWNRDYSEDTDALALLRTIAV